MTSAKKEGELARIMQQIVRDRKPCEKKPYHISVNQGIYIEPSMVSESRQRQVDKCKNFIDSFLT